MDKLGAGPETEDQEEKLEQFGRDDRASRRTEEEKREEEEHWNVSLALEGWSYPGEDSPDDPSHFSI